MSEAGEGGEESWRVVRVLWVWRGLEKEVASEYGGVVWGKVCSIDGGWEWE